MKLTILALAVFGLASCASMGPNDGMVPRLGAQANLPYIPTVQANGLLAAPDRASSGMMVAPLADTRRAFWQ